MLRTIIATIMSTHKLSAITRILMTIHMPGTITTNTITLTAPARKRGWRISFDLTRMIIAWRRSTRRSPTRAASGP